jgi:hypothetical protein
MDPASCVDGLTNSSAIGQGESITRILNLQVSGPSEINIAVSSSPSGWSRTVSGGTTVLCGTGGCTQNRTITINGDHWTASANGASIFDFTVSSNGIVTSGVGASRTISSGIITTQSNLTQEIAQTTINGPLQTTTGCCFPTEGSVTTSYTNGANNGKTETLSFGPACGRGLLTSVNGQTSSVTLAECF